MADPLALRAGGVRLRVGCGRGLRVGWAGRVTDQSESRARDVIAGGEGGVQRDSDWRGRAGYSESVISAAVAQAGGSESHRRGRDQLKGAVIGVAVARSGTPWGSGGRDHRP